MSSRYVGSRNSPTVLPKASLQCLLDVLREEGYSVIAPVCQDGAILLRPVTSTEQIARGLRDEQDGGRYRLVPGDPDLYFSYAVGLDSGKRHFFPSQQELFSLRVEDESFLLTQALPRAPKLALLGLRPCDLVACDILDQVFGVRRDQETFRCESETFYREVRDQSLLVAVNCTEPSGTCFCVSMGTGPRAAEGFDLALTELREGFVVHVGSQRGETVVARLPVHQPSAAELELEELKLRQAAEHMGRQLETGDLRDLLQSHVRHPHWERVARRCLACGNCTLVCPTCFCSTVTDTNDLGTGAVTRKRRWDSCFTHQFSYTTGGTVRNSIRGRYRHWLRHKLGTWWEQFGRFGCVGCGRCITWCPVGIDLTAEVDGLRQTPLSAADLAASGVEGEVRSW